MWIIITILFQNSKKLTTDFLQFSATCWSWVFLPGWWSMLGFPKLKMWTTFFICFSWEFDIYHAFGTIFTSWLILIPFFWGPPNTYKFIFESRWFQMESDFHKNSYLRFFLAVFDQTPSSMSSSYKYISTFFTYEFLSKILYLIA